MFFAHCNVLITLSCAEDGYPFVRAADRVLVDNTAMGIEETARLIVMLAHEKQNEVAGAGASKPAAR